MLPENLLNDFRDAMDLWRETRLVETAFICRHPSRDAPRDRSRPYICSTDAGVARDALDGRRSGGSHRTIARDPAASSAPRAVSNSCSAGCCSVLPWRARWTARRTRSRSPVIPMAARTSWRPESPRRASASPIAATGSRVPCTQSVAHRARYRSHGCDARSRRHRRAHVRCRRAFVAAQPAIAYLRVLPPVDRARSVDQARRLSSVHRPARRAALGRPWIAHRSACACYGLVSHRSPPGCRTESGLGTRERPAARGTR